MKDTAKVFRGAVVVCLVLAPVLMLISSVLQPPFVTDYVDRLADVDRRRRRRVGVERPLHAHPGRRCWSRSSASPTCSASAALGSPSSARVLGVLATFAEAVMGGTGLVYLTMASDAENRELFAGVWEQMESSPVMLFAMLGFGGTVLTLVLLSIGLFRSRVVPAGSRPWSGLFLVLEFFGSALTEYASYAAALCLLLAFGDPGPARARQSPRRLAPALAAGRSLTVARLTRPPGQIGRHAGRHRRRLRFPRDVT